MQPSQDAESSASPESGSPSPPWRAHKQPTTTAHEIDDYPRQRPPTLPHPPSSSRDTSPTPSENSDDPRPRVRVDNQYELARRREEATRRLADTWNAIYDKYGNVPLEDDDEIDLTNWKVERDRGTLRHLRQPCGRLGESIDVESDDDADVFVESSRPARSGRLEPDDDGGYSDDGVAAEPGPSAEDMRELESFLAAERQLRRERAARGTDMDLYWDNGDPTAPSPYRARRSSRPFAPLRFSQPSSALTQAVNKHRRRLQAVARPTGEIQIRKIYPVHPRRMPDLIPDGLLDPGGYLPPRRQITVVKARLKLRPHDADREAPVAFPLDLPQPVPEAFPLPARHLPPLDSIPAEGHDAVEVNADSHAPATSVRRCRACRKFGGQRRELAHACRGRVRPRFCPHENPDMDGSKSDDGSLPIDVPYLAPVQHPNGDRRRNAVRRCKSCLSAGGQREANAHACQGRFRRKACVGFNDELPLSDGEDSDLDEEDIPYAESDDSLDLTTDDELGERYDADEGSSEEDTDEESDEERVDRVPDSYITSQLSHHTTDFEDLLDESDDEQFVSIAPGRVAVSMSESEGMFESPLEEPPLRETYSDDSETDGEHQMQDSEGLRVSSPEDTFESPAEESELDERQVEDAQIEEPQWVGSEVEAEPQVDEEPMEAAVAPAVVETPGTSTADVHVVVAPLAAAEEPGSRRSSRRISGQKQINYDDFVAAGMSPRASSPLTTESSAPPSPATSSLPSSSPPAKRGRQIGPRRQSAPAKFRSRKNSTARVLDEMVEESRSLPTIAAANQKQTSRNLQSSFPSPPRSSSAALEGAASSRETPFATASEFGNTPPRTASPSPSASSARTSSGQAAKLLRRYIVNPRRLTPLPTGPLPSVPKRVAAVRRESTYIVHVRRRQSLVPESVTAAELSSQQPILPPSPIASSDSVSTVAKAPWHALKVAETTASPKHSTGAFSLSSTPRLSFTPKPTSSPHPTGVFILKASSRRSSQPNVTHSTSAFTLTTSTRQSSVSPHKRKASSNDNNTPVENNIASTASPARKRRRTTMSAILDIGAAPSASPTRRSASQGRPPRVSA